MGKFETFSPIGTTDHSATAALMATAVTQSTTECLSRQLHAGLLKRQTCSTEGTAQCEQAQAVAVVHCGLHGEHLNKHNATEQHGRRRPHSTRWRGDNLLYVGRTTSGRQHTAETCAVDSTQRRPARWTANM
jgi:hypothetical protein